MRNAGEGGQPDTEALMSMQGSMGLIQLVSIVSSLVSTTVILSAIYRAVLEPDVAFKELLDAGVGAIQTDVPELAVRTLERQGHGLSVEHR